MKATFTAICETHPTVTCGHKHRTPDAAALCSHEWSTSGKHILYLGSIVGTDGSRWEIRTIRKYRGHLPSSFVKAYAVRSAG
jgi:hypothetical protein